MKKGLLFALVCVVVAGLGFTSCKKEEQAKGNTFKVRMTDAPGDFAQLNVQVNAVDAYLDGKGWVNLSSETQSVNVLSLTNGSEIQLANATSVESGLYTKLRIRFASQASIMLVGGSSSLSLNWTGSSQEVEIAINQQISADAGASLLLDFNVAQSVNEIAGIFSLNPVITVIADEETGIQGSVSGAAYAMVQVSNGNKTYTTYLNAQGKFMLRGLEPGTYTVAVMKSGSSELQQVGNATVAKGEITQMGTMDV